MEIKKPKITDYNIVEGDESKHRVLDYDQVKFEFDNCFFIISQNKYAPESIQVYKIAKKAAATDQVSVNPQSQNVINIY